MIIISSTDFYIQEIEISLIIFSTDFLIQEIEISFEKFIVLSLSVDIYEYNCL